MSTYNQNSFVKVPKISDLDNDLKLKLNAVAVKRGQEITLQNGLILNHNKTGRMSVNLKLLFYSMNDEAI